jgi:uncharacterized C2H2 Zn-finger protein
MLIDLLSAGDKASVTVPPDMTALWELKMTDIESGEVSLESYLSEVADMVRGILSDKLAIPANISGVQGLTRQARCLTEDCDGFLRHIKKPGKTPFFSCPLCHATFNDIDGAPVPKKKFTGEIVEAPCPLGCGRNARRFSGRYGHFWKCLCSPDAIFKDSNGVPAVNEKRPVSNCPVAGCKGNAARFTRKDGGHFWKCPKCGNFFDDIDGVPVIQKKSGKTSATRGRKGLYDYNDNQGEADTVDNNRCYPVLRSVSGSGRSTRGGGSRCRS